jgi:ATP-binding protein involved in chromosome partitioning
MSDDNSTDEVLLAALRGVKYPGFPRDLVSLGMVAGAVQDGSTARISLRLPGGRTDIPEALVRDVEAALRTAGFRAELSIAAPTAAPPKEAEAGPALLPGVRAILAVSSAKGGVGKSTVATNLACAFANLGLDVGLLDADVYGPSLPIMMGIEQRPLAAGGNRFHPVERHGVRCISMGFFLDDSSPVIWRGPMVAGLVRQFLADCVWGELDVLVIDLPPGTGDAPLTLAQQVQLHGALIVTTPQEVALRDAARGLAMFRQLHVPILGIVENMSSFRCPECGEAEKIFAGDAGRRLAEMAGAPLLAQLPLEVAVRAHGDNGRPVVLAEPDSAAARALTEVALRLGRGLGAIASDVASGPAVRAPGARADA